MTLFNVSKKARLSDRDHDLYAFICNVSKENRECRKRKETLKERVRRAENYMNTGWTSVLERFSSQARSFIECHLRNVNRNKFSRRYTLDDKLFAFALYKKSPTAYRYLANIFCLPSEGSVRKLSSELPLKPGLCNELMNSLEEQGRKMIDPKDRLCVLMCDDVEIQTSITFNESAERVEGFVDNGIDRKREIADHATVWLVKGVNPKIGKKTWKQPLVYTFCKSSQSSVDFKKMYFEIVRRLQDIGFTVIASISDQGSTNEKAVRELIDETKANLLSDDKDCSQDIIMIDDLEIVHIFDPPHLIKCLRNNLLTKDLKYSWEGKERIASWSHLMKAFEIDKQNGIFRLFQKLSVANIYPNNKEKMRVPLCKRVFSHTTASHLMFMCNNKSKSLDGKLQMDEQGLDTALLFHIVDNLFDSLNCEDIAINFESQQAQNEKHKYKSVIPTDSDCPHEKLWDKAIEMFENMRFIKKNPNDRERPNVLKNFVHTLKAFKILREKMKTYGFTHFAGKVFNQDPVENFFCQMKQHGIRNTKPTTTDFSCYYKSILVNTLVKNNTKGSNCLDDDSSGFLVTMKALFRNESNSLETSWTLPDLPDSFNASKPFPITNFFDDMSGKGILNCLDVDCFACRENLLLSCNRIDCAKDCDKDNFQHCALKIFNICFYFFPVVCHKDNFLTKIKEFLLQNVSFEFKDCEHTKSLKIIVVNKCVSVISKCYFSFLQQLGKGLPIAPEHDELMKIVYNCSQRYKKKNDTAYGKNVELLYAAECDKNTSQSICNKVLKVVDTNAVQKANTIQLKAVNNNVYIPIKTLPYKNACENKVIQKLSNTNVYSHNTNNIKLSILPKNKILNVNNGLTKVLLPNENVCDSNVYDRAKIVQLKNNNDIVSRNGYNNEKVITLHYVPNIKNNTSDCKVLMPDVRRVGDISNIYKPNSMQLENNNNFTTHSNSNNKKVITVLSKPNILKKSNNDLQVLVEDNEKVCANISNVVHKSNVVQLKRSNGTILSNINSNNKVITVQRKPNILKKVFNNIQCPVTDNEKVCDNISNVHKSNIVQLKNINGITLSNNNNNNKAVTLQRMPNNSKNVNYNTQLLVSNNEKVCDNNCINPPQKAKLSKIKYNDTTAYVPAKKFCYNSNNVNQLVTLYHKLHKNE